MFYLARHSTLLLTMLFTLLPMTTTGYANLADLDPIILHYPDATFSEEHAGQNGLLQPNPTISEIAIYPESLNSLTVIRISVCTDAPHFQLRWSMDGPDGFMTEIFVRPTSCSSDFGHGSRVMLNAVLGQVFTLYLWSSQQLLSEDDFMQRAARWRITVIGLGRINTERIPPLTVPAATVEEPSSGATAQGTITVRGWALNAASWHGTGVDQVQIHSGGQLLDTASYGQPRPDVGTDYGDPRFNNSGYSYQLDTTRLTNGSHTIQVRYRSSFDETWHIVEREINVSNPEVPIVRPSEVKVYLPLVQR
ncbi:Ig-like domain-containing protein [Candidatus Viridilinea mediisalina]|uniref:Uncharacterized protein n=1 Tax=Candidatus Viridilinea mediisalina TaxID=2024553 RepID=A0A2A6RLK1_9CHLR|nr:Ig-like domain-containing protein [Candidatus Viridilinea mediisalina]PDW03720.1 hypothetical protein CJ255_07380 [Candidatus Viridilinea mediisalina]